QAAEPADDAIVRMVIRFRDGLQLADLKAQLIVNRLAGLADVKSTQPALDSLPEDEQLEEFEIRLETHEDLESLRAAADVDGVESIDFPGVSAEPAVAVDPEVPSQQDSPDVEPTDHPEDDGELTDESEAASPVADSELQHGEWSDGFRGPDLLHGYISNL
ncbi:unnamed protein product, partial [marine sediment metagenome]